MYAIVAVLLIVAYPMVAAATIWLILPRWRRWRWRPGSHQHGITRRLSKPFHRWAFRQGKLFTKESIDYFTGKYALKYLRKRTKLGIDSDRCSGSTAAMLSAAELEQLVRLVTAALHDGDEVATVLAERLVHIAPSLRQALAAYTTGLHAAACKNIGLSHAKVREYWIYRGPKWLVVTVLLIASFLVVEELLGDPSPRDRMARVAMSVIAMTASCTMLYFKLPDAIRSSVARSAHDYYVQAKKTELKGAGRGRESSDDAPTLSRTDAADAGAEGDDSHLGFSSDATDELSSEDGECPPLAEGAAQGPHSRAVGVAREKRAWLSISRRFDVVKRFRGRAADEPAVPASTPASEVASGEASGLQAAQQRAQQGAELV